MKRGTTTLKEDGREGCVVRAKRNTFSDLEKTARRENAKGAYIVRGRHPRENEIAEWLKEKEEEEFECGEIEVIGLNVAPSRNKCEDENCDDCDDGEHLAGPEEIREACKKLVEKLPASFRDAVRSDAEKIATMSRRLCPNVPWLVLKLEICQYLRCIKWHQDYYTSRTLVTYVGPGTCAADDKDVRWNEIDVEGPNDGCVKNVKQMETNSVLLMKGNFWPGIRGKGLTHKSPASAKNPPPKRLILKVDLQDDVILDPDDVEEEEEEGDQSPTKRRRVDDE